MSILTFFIAVGDRAQLSLGLMAEPFRVSVIIPVYNAGTRVRRAVESAIALPEVGEVILVEDGSPDGALKVCSDLAAEHSQVRLFQHPDGVNHGAGASRNLGVRQAAFPYIAFLDADDWWLPNRFEAERVLFSADPSLDGVYGAISHRYENEDVHARWVAQGREEILTVSAPVPPEELVFVLLWSHPRVRGEFHTIAVTVKRSFFDRIGGFHEDLRLQQDTHLWKRMAAGGRLAAGSIVDPVAIQDIHGENRMTRAEDHYQYLYLWWSSLGRSLRVMRVNPAVMQAWRRAYASYRARRGPRWKAVIGLASWALRQPSEIKIAYGHFDLTLRNIFDSHYSVLRMLSFKNRLMARNS